MSARTNQSRRIIVLFSIGAVVAAGAITRSPARAEVIRTVTPSADTYASQQNPDVDHGSLPTLRVDADPVRTAYLRFDLGADSTGAIGATLRVFAESGSDVGFDVRQVSDVSWSEELTYTNAPPVGDGILARSGALAAGTWIEVDLGAVVRDRSAVALALTTTSTSSFYLSSRESATAPRLLVRSQTTTASPSPTASGGAGQATTSPSASTSAPPPQPTASPTTTVPAVQPTASPTKVPDSPQPSAGTSSPPPAPSGDLRFPIRAAFYYPWFPEAWRQQGIYPYTNYEPSIGFYDGGNVDTVRKHIQDMQYGHIQAGIASWWGRGSKEDLRMPVLLEAARGTGFRWSVYHEPEGYRDPSVSEIAADLARLRELAADPSYLRVGGRFVVFVYAQGTDGCGMVDRWTQANTVGAHLVLKVFPGYRNCASQPSGWHQYAPAVASDAQAPYSYSISPGFWLKGAAVRLPRDPARWSQNVQAMASSPTQFQLVTTYNEWGEGTSVEGAKEWASASGHGVYMDALHRYPPAASGPVSTTTSPGSTASPSPQPKPTTPATETTSASPTPSSASPSSTPSPSSGASPSPTSPPSSGDPVIAAAGDIACDPSDGSFNGGSGTASACRMKATSQLLSGVDAVIVPGDIQYENGSLAKFRSSYDLSWGRYRSITRPVPGNHEYQTPGAAGYFDYFGAAAGSRTKGYYSYDIGRWHIVALNSNCSQVGGCGVGSPQESWLRADLAAHPTSCTLAYWHHPRFSSGEHGSSTATDAFWRALHSYGAEVVIAGHDHDYERFAPQSPSGAADATRGIRQFVVGTGGKSHYGFKTVLPNSEVRNGSTYGVLKLTLHPSSYDWRFVPEAGATFTDSGSSACH